MKPDISLLLRPILVKVLFLLKESKTTTLHNKIDLLEKPVKIQLVSGIQSYSVYRQTNPPTPTANFVGMGMVFLQLSLRWNSNRAGVYHKSKLVGVENMPYKSFFKPLFESFCST